MSELFASIHILEDDCIKIFSVVTFPWYDYTIIYYNIIRKCLSSG